MRNVGQTELLFFLPSVSRRGRGRGGEGGSGGEGRGRVNLLDYLETN